MSLVDKVLSLLGLVRSAEYAKLKDERESFRSNCEEFAKDYLSATSGFTIGTLPGIIEGGVFHKSAAIIGSGMRVNNIEVEKGVVIAPWVSNLSITNLDGYKSTLPQKNHRAVVSILSNCDNPMQYSKVTMDKEV